MRRATTELIVPIRDRRQHRRYLTVKNVRNAFLLIVAVFAGITIEANLRNPKTNDDYGRLYAAKMQAVPDIQKKPQTIADAPIQDATAADPTLVVAQARAQILTGESDPQPVAAAATTMTQQQAQAPLVGHDAQGRLVIVGGPEGVTLVQQSSTKPVLGGGFGRTQ